MSSGLQASSSDAPNFQLIFEKALQEYQNKTGKDLTAHPLAAEIKGCGSPDAILTVLEGKANELSPSRSDERLTKWLTPTVNILNALSATLGEGVGLVFPPTKIIFSGIGILLVAAKGTVAYRDVLVKLFGRIESFFERLKIYTKVPPSPEVTDELAKIMAEVLSILAIATKGIKKGRLKIFLQKMAGLTDLEDALQMFGEFEQRELLTGIAQVSSDTSGLKDGVKRIEAIAQQIVTDRSAHDWKKLLQDLRGWLSPPDPSTNHNIACGTQHERTSAWLFKDIMFKEWESNGSLLWIHGKPGSGKSVLCSAIIQHIEAQHDAKSASISYFYFDFKDTEKQNQRNLLRSLLIQLSASSNPCCDIMYRVYLEHSKGTRQPSEGSLRKCLKEMLSAMTQHPNYIIMDALDECPNTTGVPSAREEVLGLVNDLVDLRLPNLHICVTSRPEIDIRTVLEPSTLRCISLHDQPGQKEDIAQYIISVVHSDNNMKRWRDDDRKLVIEALSEKADGMFRWVFCQLEMLRHCLAPSLRRQLNELPKSLDETYMRVLRDIHSTNQDNARRLLHCLAVAKRPLRVEELAEVLAFDLDGEIPTFHAEWRWEDQEQAVLSACSSLISVVDNEGSRVVQFSHFSVKEFLTSKRLAAASGDVSQHHILPGPAHAVLTRACLGVLLHLDHHVNNKNAKNIPLAEYAANHWVSHAQEENVSSRVRHAMEALFDSEKPHFSAWLRIYCTDPQPRFRSIPLRGKSGFLLRRYGYKRFEPPPVVEIPPVYAKPLYYSALFGFHNLVEQLAIKNPQQVNTIGGDYDTPLSVALRWKHFRIAEFLLEHGANIDVRGSKNQTPLHTVIQRSDNDAMLFLLKHGADVNARWDDLSTPLHLAASTGRFEAAQMLLAHKADTDSRNGWGQAPLHLVAEPRLAQLLLDFGADVNARDNHHATPLHSRTLNPFPYEYRRLMTWGPDTVRVLIDHGANVDVENDKGQTLLHLLSESRSFGDGTRFQVEIDIARLLLERGANANARDKDSATPLHSASAKFGVPIAPVLLDNGADVSAQDSHGRTPLHLLLKNNFYRKDCLQFVLLFLKHGVDVNAEDEDHATALHWAFDHRRPEVVPVLLDHGANPNAENNLGQTPLHRLVLIEECEELGNLVPKLLEHGANPNAHDKDGVTPLQVASRNGLLEVARLFRQYGAKEATENDLGQTPLHTAHDCT